MADAQMNERLDQLEETYGLIQMLGNREKNVIPVVNAIDACIQGTDAEKATVLIAYTLLCAGVSESPNERCDFEDFSDEMHELSDLHFAEDKAGLAQNALFQQVQLVKATMHKIAAASTPRVSSAPRR